MQWDVPIDLTPRESEFAKAVGRRGKFYLFLRAVRHLLLDERLKRQMEKAYGNKARAREPEWAVMMLMLTLLQAYARCSAGEAVALSKSEEGWKLVLTTLGGCVALSKHALCRFRRRLVEHSVDKALFARVGELARESKLFDPKKVTRMRSSMNRGPRPIRASQRTREKLERVARASAIEHRLVVRAQLALLLLDGLGDAEIGRRMQIAERTVFKWRQRFGKRPKLSTLYDLPRSGRPATIPLEARCEVLRLACERPAAPPEAPKARFRSVWTYDSLQQAAEAKGAKMCRSEVYRTLHDRQLRPAQIQMWLNSQDPEFRDKAKRVCQLYLHPPKGARVFCVDEKTGMQALERAHPDSPARPGRRARREYEYIRHGTSTLIAAFEVKTGKVLGVCGETRGADDLIEFMETLARSIPRGPVYIIWDNLNIHHGERWEQFNARHGGRFHFVYTPLHASWLNQVEIWFGILHRRVLKYGSFKSVQQLVEQVCGFIQHWNDFEAHPFRWKFRGFRTKSDLRRVA
jgi:transposase